MKIKIAFPHQTFSYPQTGRDKDIEALGFKISRDKKAEYWVVIKGSLTKDFASIEDLFSFMKDWPKARIDQTEKVPVLMMLGHK